MEITVNEFDIAQIADSGQCFRINNIKDKTYSVIHAGKYLEVRQEKMNGNGSNVITLSCGKEEYERIWKPYFDIDTDYGKILGMIDRGDEFLTNAARYGSGIRILRQEPWEMLISFIISQRKSIPAIKTSIERLCKLCGDRIDTSSGEFYAFPDAVRVASLSQASLDKCGMGYRSGYISTVARQVAEGEIDLYSWEDLSDGRLMEELIKLRGVGAKVANCVMLFGYHRIDAFPEDVWIKRALAEYYPDGFPHSMYPSCAGVMQQYIFHYIKNGAFHG